MSLPLFTAIQIADTAHGIVQRVKWYDQIEPTDPKIAEAIRFDGVDPVLLALAMELALKAWYMHDHDTTEAKRSHDFVKLYESLTAKSQTKLDQVFRMQIAPFWRNSFLLDYGFKDFLAKHANAFVTWRYQHEIRTAHFETGAFVATVELVIGEFRKRYIVR